ncbi:hypothetical protein TNCV_2247911 [Trichonephila clavipes]|nr:hypothetical protein TNCV_2247911 [Trichonephila clavipes]
MDPVLSIPCKNCPHSFGLATSLRSALFPTYIYDFVVLGHTRTISSVRRKHNRNSSHGFQVVLCAINMVMSSEEALQALSCCK